MTKQLWKTPEATKSIKTYKTYENAIKAADKILGNLDHVRYLVAVTADGRFFPVAIGKDALDCGVHFHMCVTG